MKNSLAKIVVPTLAICLGAALVGSISGTVAWYQYSTRASTAYLGTSAGTSENLRVRIKGTNTDQDDKWTSQLTKEAIQAYLGADKKVQPITSGNMVKDAALSGTFWKNPVRSFEDQVFDYNQWLEADTSMYVEIPLEFCYTEKDGVKDADLKDERLLAKDVYLSDLLIQEDYQNDEDQDNLKKDLSTAIRVHLSASYEEEGEGGQMEAKTSNKLISKNGGTILTAGHLDLDGDGEMDKVNVGSDAGAKYGFGKDTAAEVVTYGSGVQTSFSNKYDVADGAYRALDAQQDTAEKVYPAVVESEDNHITLKDASLTYAEEGVQDPVSKKIGRTYASAEAGQEQKYLEVKVTIWLEGWQLLEEPVVANQEPTYSALWDATDYIGSMFDVGMQFAVQAK